MRVLRFQIATSCMKPTSTPLLIFLAMTSACSAVSPCGTFAITPYMSTNELASIG